MEENAKNREDFNLVDEPWIILLSKDGRTAKKSLKEAFLCAQDFVDIGGEVRLQDAAILRLMSAVSIKILYTYDEHGDEKPLCSKRDAERRFAAVWKTGKFCGRAVEEYFKKWHERFWLFDSRYPFYQIPLEGLQTTEKTDCPYARAPVMEYGTAMTWFPIANINARVQRSNNRPYAPYKDISDDRIGEADYDEAARWLVFYLAYADCVAGKNRKAECGKLKGQYVNSKQTLPAHGARVTPVGENLFETVMLNSCLFYLRGELYGSCTPAWEKDVFDRGIVSDLSMPYDLPQVFTSQSRRVSLVRDKGKVVGAFVSAGEAYTDDSLWTEPTFMTDTLKDKNGAVFHVIKHCLSSTDTWRDIAYITGRSGNTGGERNEGAKIAKWVALLAENEEIIPEDRVIPFRVTDISYKSMYCGIDTMFEDRILLNRRFLTESDIQDSAFAEIGTVEKLAKAVYSFGNACSLCMDREKKDTRIAKTLQRQYTEKAGTAFRDFISGKISLEELQAAEYRAAEEVAADYVEANTQILLKGKRGEDGTNIGKAYGDFLKKIGRYAPKNR
jgi:CRISPR system Cascade subunit CasA